MPTAAENAPTAESLVDWASALHGARVSAHSPACEAPNNMAALLTPLAPGEDPVCHYAAAQTPPAGPEEANWLEIALPLARRVESLEIEWWKPEEAGVAFTLEAQDENGRWREALAETAGAEKISAEGRYAAPLAEPVRAARFRFRLTRALGQGRLLVRRLRLLGGGPAPRRVLMLAPDNYMIDRRILQEARSLLDAGWRVTLLSGFEAREERTYFENGVEIHRYEFDWDDSRIKRLRDRIRNPKLRLFVHRAFMALAKYVLRFNSYDMFILDRARRFPADVVHVHDLPMLKHGARLASERGVPLVFDAHEIYYEQEVLSPRQQKRLRREEKRFLPKADLFITVNEAIGECFRDIHGERLRPMILMNAADRVTDLDRTASRRRLRAMAGLGDDVRIVLFQGWISAERNLATLVRAAKHFPEDCRLAMIGYGAHQEELERIAVEEGIAQRVHFLGRVEPSEILPLTAGADLGVIPYLPIDLNHRFCSPNKFFEYVQTGVPIVAHDLPFFRAMNERWGVAATGDLSTPEGMAEAICALLERPERLERMHAACRRAAEELNWDVEGGKLVAAYAERFGGPGA